MLNGNADNPDVKAIAQDIAEAHQVVPHYVSMYPVPNSHRIVAFAPAEVTAETVHDWCFTTVVVDSKKVTLEDGSEYICWLVE